MSDPRIDSALTWCAQRGIADIVLAVPFRLGADGEHALLERLRRTEIASLVLQDAGAIPEHGDRIGVFRPADYTWDLPQVLGRHILYIGTRPNLTARMLKTALRRGVRGIYFWDLDGWTGAPVARLAAGKLLGKAIGAWERLAWRPSQGPGLALQDRFYARRMETALGAGPLLGEPGLPPARGIVIACPTLVAGGAERQIVNTAVGLHRLGYSNLTVLVARLRYPPGNDFFLAPLESAGIAVRELGGPTETLTGWELHRRDSWLGPQGARVLAGLKKLPADLVQDVVQACAVLRELRPAVVHCWLDYSSIRVGLAAVLAGVPRIVLSGRNVSPVNFPYIHEPFMRAAYRVLASRPGVLLVNNSRGGADDYARWLGLPPARLRVLYNGADLATTTRAAPEAIAEQRQRWGIPDGALVVGGLFRFSDEKRPLLWLATAAQVASSHREAWFVLFGAGPREAEMRAYLAAHGLADRVRLAPPTAESVLALSSFDLLLLTSEWEGTPNVAIEAQAVGTPVVATGGGGAREALDPGATGLYVERPNAHALAHAVCGLLADPGRRAAMGAAGPDFVGRRFSMATMLRETLDSYGVDPAGLALSQRAVESGASPRAHVPVAALGRDLDRSELGVP